VERIPREELRATLEARRELGPGFDDELVERFAERLEARLGQTSRPPATLTSEQRTGIAIVSVIAAIPLLGIASGSGVPGIALVCLALVLVNLFAFRA
jgi:hypothetical protein